MISRLSVLYNTVPLFKYTVTIPKIAVQSGVNHNLVRKITNKHGAVLQEPHRTSFGILKIFVTVISGLLVGAVISKSIANFLEENELFVPSDDDDDDD